MALTAAALAGAPLGAQTLTIPTVLVGNPGNIGEPQDFFFVGGVGYTYHIGKYEVTNTEYTAFLNAVAATDSFALYNANMGGITRSGTSGSFTYAVTPGHENLPVTFVSFWDAARFVNWLGTGYTEGQVSPGSGLLPGAAYNTNFVTNPPLSATTRLGGAKVFLPSRDEWYKAAYFEPSAPTGSAGFYWDYPTRSNSAPGNPVPGPATNAANFFNNGVFAVSQSPSIGPGQNFLAPVGSYGPASESYYGAADMGGNVIEWIDGRDFTLTFGAARGGGWNTIALTLASTHEYSEFPNVASSDFGFRVASLQPIPEPRTFAALAGLAALAGILAFRRRS